MANVYGMMVLNQSKDIDCDFDGLVDELNRYQWNTSCNLWSKNVSHDKSIFVHMDTNGYSQIHDPSVFPDELKGVVLLEDDSKQRFVENPSLEELEDAWDCVYEPVSLENLVLRISKHIKNGYIEISSVCNEKNRYVSMEKLIVNYDKSGMRSTVMSGKGRSKEIIERV
jgi:hypothetical protein